MNMLEPWLVALLSVMLFLGLHALLRQRRKRRTAKQRVVEPPNSAFSSTLVRHREQADRWKAIQLNRLHPLNRSEVQRLLDIVTSGGTTTLSEGERTFLDYLSEIAAPGGGRGGASRGSLKGT